MALFRGKGPRPDRELRIKQVKKEIGKELMIRR